MRRNRFQPRGLVSVYSDREHSKAIVETIALLASKALFLAVADEVHRFIAFGVSFRTKFFALRNYLFSKLTKSEYNHDLEKVLKVHVLLMTNNVSQEIMRQLSKMTNLVLRR